MHQNGNLKSKKNSTNTWGALIRACHIDGKVMLSKVSIRKKATRRSKVQDIAKQQKKIQIGIGLMQLYYAQAYFKLQR